VLPGDIYTRQMLERHHRAALEHTSRVPAWQRGEVPLRSISARRHGSRLRLFLRRFRPAHGDM